MKKNSTIFVFLWSNLNRMYLHYISSNVNSNFEENTKVVNVDDSKSFGKFRYNEAQSSALS